MNYSEFRRHLGKAGMTVNQFAAYLRVRPSSVSNYAKAGNVPPTYAVIAVLAGEAADRGLCVAELLKRYGISPQESHKNNVRQLDMFRAQKAKS